MIPHHVYYQLAVVGFLWLCIMLHYVWPSQNAVSPQLPTTPLPPKSKRKRTSAPKPFEGLTQRPIAPCVSTTRIILTSRLHGDPIPCLRPTDAHVQSTPRGIFVPMRAVLIKAGWDLATSAPTAIPAVARGDSGTVALVGDIFWRPMVRSCTASACRSS
jgi:hypothetical protein